MNEQAQPFFTRSDDGLNPLAIADIAINAEYRFPAPVVNRRHADQKVDAFARPIEVRSLGTLSVTDQAWVVARLARKLFHRFPDELRFGRAIDSQSAFIGIQDLERLGVKNEDGIVHRVEQRTA